MHSAARSARASVWVMRVLTRTSSRRRSGSSAAKTPRIALRIIGPLPAL
jgi:hypothetical protein